MSAATARPRRAASRDALAGAWMIRETVAVSVTLCALVPALLPLAMGGMAATHDGFLHVQRTIVLEAAARQGAPFTRWLPELAYGYGQPLLLYYAPLSYLPALAARALGLGYVASFGAASGLALVLSALSMLVLVRSHLGPPAAAAAAVVYALLPYQLVDLYVRGALAESWAFVWMPLCVWCLVMADANSRLRWSVGLALAVAGLILTHNVTALLFLPALGLLAAALAIARWRLGGGAAVRPLLAILLGLTLSAWFWLPALAERDLVQIGETLEPALFASFFLRSWPPFRLDLLYDYERPVSTALGSPIFWPQLGVVQVVLALAGAVAALRLAGTWRIVALWAVALAVGGLALQLGPMAWLFDLVPLLAFVQFPWRLLAIVGLGSAILAGVLVETISRRTDIRAVLSLVVVVVSLVAAVGRLSPEMTQVDERLLSTETITRLELAEYGLGTTHSGEYLPVTSGQRNAARFRKSLVDAGGEGARHVQPRGDGLRIERLDWRPDRITVEVTTPSPERLVVHQFAFPGWQATVNGAPATTSRAGPLGLLAVDAPAGRSTVELHWGWTPLRSGATAVSLVGLALLGLLAVKRVARPAARAVGGGAAAAALVAALVVPSWSAWTPGGTVASESTRWQPVDESLTLVDVRLDASRLAADRVVISELVWLVRRPPTASYRAHVEVAATNGTAHRAVWTYEPLSRLWERGELVPTTVPIRLPTSFPAGPAAIKLVFDRPEGLPAVALGSLLVPPSSAAPPNASATESIDLPPSLRLRASPGPDGQPTTRRVRPGAVLDVPLRWEATGRLPDVDREMVVTLSLAAPGGEIVSEPRRPGDWFSPLPFWQAGDSVEQRIRIAVPAGVPPGSYPLTARVYARDLARGGASEPGASSARARGRPVAELQLGQVSVTP